MDMNNLTKGIGVGIALAGIATVAKGCMCDTSSKKQIKKAMKSVEGLVDDIKYMFK